MSITPYETIEETPEAKAALLALAAAQPETDVPDVQSGNGADCNGTRTVSDDVPNVPAEADRPCFKAFDHEVMHADESKLRPGVYHFGKKVTKNGTSLTQQWICTPLYIDAVTLDGQDNNFGRLLRFLTTTGKWRTWAMPMELLSGSGEGLRGELLSMGVSIDPNSHRLLGKYLQEKIPERQMQCAVQAGWCGDSFVLPDTVIGAGASGVIFQSGERGHDEFTKGGTLAGWQSEIAALAIGNPLLLLALSASFVGPLLLKCNAESGGIHLVGDSSTGKTTLIKAACSTWGGEGYARSWRATANGLEGAGALFNDGLLALDEISQCDPKEIGSIVYALGNGVGKQRASRSGNARSVTRWRCMVISSGERSIETAMQAGGQRIKAGQSMRLLDIPVVGAFGAWNDLHGLSSGSAFSDALRRASSTHYGHAGREFLENLTREERDLGKYFEQFKALKQFSTEGGEGQDKRASARFALLALAGELATEYGITGWPEGMATEAVSTGFKAWKSMRGRGNDEKRKIIEQLLGFIEKHGDSRFSNADEDVNSKTINRAGWWRDEEGERIYLFNKDGLREALTGFDFRRALDSLQEAGALRPKSSERSTPLNIGKRKLRVYPIHISNLRDDYGN